MKIKPAHNKQLNQDGYAIDITISGKRLRQWFATRREAEAAIAQLTLEKRARKIGLPLPKQNQAVLLADLYAARAREMQAFPSWQNSKAYVREFISHCPADARLDQVGAAHIASYVAALQARDLNNNTINNYLSKVGAFLNSAARHFPDCGYKLPHLPYVPSVPTTDRVLSGPELARLYRALTNPQPLNDHEIATTRERRLDLVADLFLACALTGARYSEILSLTWSAISFDFSTFTLNATKTGDKRTLPLTPELRALFLRRKKQRGSESPYPAINKQTLQRCLYWAGEAVSIPYGENTGWTIKTLRHTAITTMLREGADFLSVSAVVGHTHQPNRSRGSMTLHYAHSSLEGMRRALTILENFWLKACQDFDGTTRQKPAKAVANR